jgi:radical SAM superfamily enzyme YgiQ (UPF0313 family)
MNKVVLIQLPSPWLMNDRDTPLLGNLYLATNLAANGIDVQIADLVGVPEDKWLIPEGDIYGISITTPQVPYARKVVSLLRNRTSHRTNIVAGGPHPSALPQWCIDTLGVDAAFVGEADHAIVEYVRHGSPTPIIKCAPVDLTTLPRMRRDFVDMRSFHIVGINNYVLWKEMKTDARYEGYLQTGRGCPFDCLGPGTPINTIEGMIPIKELAETRESIGVFTYDFVERRVKVSTAYHISMRRPHTDMVRVSFDDGSHIDCTPDHKFVAFSWGNQYRGEKEWSVEAKDLTKGTHLRAIKESLSGPVGNEYVEVAWARRKRAKKHVLVAEGVLGRKLIYPEQVHHIDGDRLNNRPVNLEVVASKKEHMLRHPEVSIRMRKNNPTKDGINGEWARKIGDSIRGIKRSDETKHRMSEAAKGRESRKRETAAVVNHCVVSVEPLEGKHDTYCLEVPDTGWFYANNVLVKNCAYCAQAVITQRKARFYPVDTVLAELDELLNYWECDFIYINDDTFNVSKKRVLQLCDVFKSRKFRWHCLARADLMDVEQANAMRDAGCLNVTFGFESGAPSVLAAMGKGETVEDGIRAADIVHEAGMGVRGQMVVGFPGETDATIQQTVDFVRRVKAERWGFHAFVPLPGSRSWTHADDFGITIAHDEDFATGFHTIGQPGEWERIVYNEEHTREWLKLLRDEAGEHNIWVKNK